MHPAPTWTGQVPAKFSRRRLVTNRRERFVAAPLPRPERLAAVRFQKGRHGRGGRHADALAEMIELLEPEPQRPRFEAEEGAHDAARRLPDGFLAPHPGIPAPMIPPGRSKAQIRLDGVEVANPCREAVLPEVPADAVRKRGVAAQVLEPSGREQDGLDKLLVRDVQPRPSPCSSAARYDSGTRWPDLVGC